MFSLCFLCFLNRPTGQLSQNRRQQTAKEIYVQAAAESCNQCCIRQSTKSDVTLPVKNPFNANAAVGAPVIMGCTHGGSINRPTNLTTLVFARWPPLISNNTCTSYVVHMTLRYNAVVDSEPSNFKNSNKVSKLEALG